MFLISILATLIVVGGLVFATLLLYLKLSRCPKLVGKKGFHFVFIAVLLSITVIIRLLCVLTIAKSDFSTESFLDGVIKSIETIYVTAGGLTFEGQEAEETMKQVTIIIYYASILWLAATFIFVVTLGLSYEMSSRAILWQGRKRAKHIYIFTAVTEDALVLANSIEDKHRDKNSGVYNEKYLIIFAGNELEPYDKDNELHRKIMARGYIYQSYYKAKDKDLETPLLVKLGIASKCHPFRVLIKKHVKIFSLENDSREYGLESKNSDVVFDDIDEMIRMEFLERPKADSISEKAILAFVQNNLDSKKMRLLGKEVNTPDLQYIDYYLLSNSTINYEFYDEAILEKLRNAIEPNLLTKFLVTTNGVAQLKDKLEEGETGVSLYTYVKSIFQIHVINESYLAGEDLIKKRRAIQIEDIKQDVALAKQDEGYRYKRFAINRIKSLNEKSSDKNNNSKVSVPDSVPNLVVSSLNKHSLNKRIQSDLEYRKKIESQKNEKRFNALILGFGQTGQMALNNLFVDTVSLEPSQPEKGINLDRYIPSRFVGYAYDLNMGQNIGIFAQTHPSYLVKKVGKNKGENYFFNYDELVEFYGKDYPGQFKEIDELLKFPFVYASDRNCKDLDFLEDIDGGTGNLNEKTTGKTLGKINAIVICLGNDEENIKVANAILQNIRQELYNSDFTNTQYFYQTIFVNIRDEKNVGRLNWNDNIEAVRHSGITVRAFGNREDLYSYNSIIEDRRFVKVNNIYVSIEEYFKEIDPSYQMSGKEKNKHILNPSIREKLKESIISKNDDMDSSRARFLRLSDYKKASNKSSALFSDYTSTYVNEMGIDELDSYENGKLWKYLGFLEHHRWNRYNMSCGYIYSKTFVDNMKTHKEDYAVYSQYGHDAKEYSKSHLKIHKCLLPNSYPNIQYLDDSTECYDDGNILCASLIAKEK